MKNHTRAAFRPETTCSDLKRRLPPYHHRESSRRRTGSSTDHLVERWPGNGVGTVVEKASFVEFDEGTAWTRTTLKQRGDTFYGVGIDPGTKRVSVSVELHRMGHRVSIRRMEERPRQGRWPSLARPRPA